jgi:hypothetical protein
MIKAPEDAERFFPRFELFRVKVSDLGYFPICLSIFDHWLSGPEYDACDFMSYREAVVKKKRGDYLTGERHFISFYQRLAQHGIFIYEGLTKEDPVTREHHDAGDFYWQAEADDPDFIDLLRKWLRDELPDTRAVEFYFPAFEVLSLPSDDRTTLLFLHNKDLLPQLKQIAKDHQLHFLSGDHLNEIHERPGLVKE